MPSQRKRIGFLPSEEVHDIIEKICIENKFSQSKVTGILVEEALRSRGVLNNKFSNLPFLKNEIITGNNINKPTIKNSLNNNYEFSTSNKNNSKNDLNMINEFIEYKFFKKIMYQNMENID